MFMGEINSTGTAINRGHASVEARPDRSVPTWESLSLPQRQELRSALKRCNSTKNSDIDLLVSNVSHDEVRAAALSLLCRRDYLIRTPSTRGKLLEALIPYAHEGRVQAYAMLSLRDEIYSRSYSVCAPAARIINATKDDRDPAITYELLDLAARITPQGGDAAARIAFILLRDSALTSGQFQLALFHARVWYVEHKGISNPWLNVIAHYPKPPAIRFLRSMVEGNISDPREYVVLKNLISLPLLPHEIAATASILTITAQKLANFFGVKNNLVATTSALAATAIILGGRYVWRAHRLDQINCRRTFEKLEAIEHLRTFLDSARDIPTVTQEKLRRAIRGALEDQTLNFLQDSSVQQAARQALESV